jgi:hypothetical protein
LKIAITLDMMSLKKADGPVMDVPTLGIYTRFPFRGPNQCSVVDEAVLLDVWLMAGGGSFVRNSFLFTKKLSGNFQRYGLRVATEYQVPKIQNSGNRVKNLQHRHFEF